MNSLQMLKKALIAYTSNTAKAIWSALSYPLVIQSTKACNVKDYRIWGAEGGVGDVNASGEYVIPVVVRGKNYFDLNKVPFSNNSTQPCNNGIKATKTSASNRGDKIPITLPVGKTIYMSMDVIDSQIGGSATRVTMGFYNKSNALVRSTNVTSTKAHKTYSFTLSEEISYVQFYFQSSSSNNAVGDYVTMDNIMLRTEGEDVWEAYVEPRIVDVCLDNPIGAEEKVQQSKDSLPSLPQFAQTTVYEVETLIPPNGIEVQYYE